MLSSDATSTLTFGEGFSASMLDMDFGKEGRKKRGAAKDHVPCDSISD